MKYIIAFILALSTLQLFAQNTLPRLESMDMLEYGMPVQKLTLKNDITIAYTDQGKGDQVILFIHGLASYIPAWKKNIAELRKDYRCIAIDLPGYGRSSKGNYTGSMSFYAECVKEFCEKLGIRQVNIAGHSMGGQIAIVAALKYPELVDKLILIAPAGFETFNKGQRQWFRDVMTVDGVRLTTVEQIRLNYAYNFYNMPDDAQFMVDDRIAIRGAKEFTDYCFNITQSVKGMVDEPVSEFLPQIKNKTLCIFGANDNLIPNRYLNGGKTEKFAKKGADRMPDCQLKMIPKAGHFVMFEKADECNRLIGEFMRQ
jgi:pimeloyl-ACP methyl ester carboxylesterase